MKYRFTFLILLFLFSCEQDHSVLGIEVARQELKEALSNSLTPVLSFNKVIPNKQTAIAVAEPILFKGYGKDQILNEKPYEIYLIDGYWVLNGTLPKGWLGGTFLIILSSKNGRVIKLTHGK